MKTIRIRRWKFPYIRGNRITAARPATNARTFAGFAYDGVEVAACIMMDAGEIESIDSKDETYGRAIAAIAVYVRLTSGGVACVATCPTVDFAMALAAMLAAGTAHGVIDRTWPGCRIT